MMTLMRQIFRVVFVLLASALYAAVAVAAFDGERAMELIRRQCALGPRVPGTPEHEAGRLWIAEELKSLDFEVAEQWFETTLPLTGKQVDACNIWAYPQDGLSSPVIVLSAHWDTRPFADNDPHNPRARMLGANDGASGVAGVLELARNLGNHPLRSHLVLAFWDAEDAGVSGDNDSWALGARYAAAHPPAWLPPIAAGFNLDLIAGHDLRLYREAYSVGAAPELVDAIWALGGVLAPHRFAQEGLRKVTDDHLPWIEKGVPFINLVGLPYAQWHTASDNPEHCSADAIGAVGTVMFTYLSRQGMALLESAETASE